jgi:hypothetical protein
MKYGMGDFNTAYANTHPPQPLINNKKEKFTVSKTNYLRPEASRLEWWKPGEPRCGEDSAELLGTSGSGRCCSSASAGQKTKC